MENKNIFGLLNIGNTCYANAALQMLFSIPEIKDYIFNDEKWEEQLKDVCIKKQCKTEEDVLDIIKRYYTIILYKFLNHYDEVKNPYIIFKLLEYRNKKIRFSIGQQNDSQEFLSVILNNLNDEFFKLKNNIDLEDDEICLKCHSIISDLLNVKYYINLKYLNYEKEEEIKERNMFLILHLKPEFKTVQDSINYISQPEIIKGYYEKLENKTDIQKTVEISTGHYLLCHLARFKGTEKNDQPLEILNNIKVNDKNYEIISIVSHSGGVASGHYVNYSKRGEEWFLFNDSFVSKTSQDSVLNNCSNGTAYILLYRLI